jgi:hypothetical protein
MAGEPIADHRLSTVTEPDAEPGAVGRAEAHHHRTPPRMEVDGTGAKLRHDAELQPARERSTSVITL